jgi:oxygen-independent coproporphyrinogen-3 oxidase
MISNTLSVDVASARRFIENHLDKRQVNKIQHSFPSPRYWTESDVPVGEIVEDRQKLRSIGRGADIELYVGVPFCIKTNPGKCGYCLFPVEDFVGYDALENYFGYLKREAAMYKEALAGQTLKSVFFGGGTSNLYKEPMYPKLMEMVRELFPSIGPEVDITLEGIPQLFTREKLATIKDCGMNRVSVGVQQINERLNSLSGRKQTTKHVVQTIEWAKEFKLACNVDLIFGWPQQTVATMVKDLETVIAWGVHDITHYELNVGGPTDFALNRYHELPSTMANLEMYRVSSELLKSNGYQQITAYNWRKPGDPAARPYEEGVVRRFNGMDTVGLGYAAITFLFSAALENGRSWSYINWRKLDEYKAAIDEGRFPVECGFRHDREDLKISLVFRNLFGLEVDRKAYLEAFGADAHDDFAGVWDALEEWKLIEVTPEKISLVGDGPFYTPMIQTLLAENRYRALRDKVVRYAKRPDVSAVGY